MIVARLLGGLGNQMFQYAMGRALALRHRTRLLLDTSWFERERPPGDTPRSFALRAFRINAIVLPAAYGGCPVGVEHGDVFALRLRRGSWPFTYVPQRSHFYEAAAVSAPRRSYLNGYWQVPDYLEAIAPTLRSDFRLAAPMTLPTLATAATIAAAEKGSPVSVHVRRGDFVTNAAAAAFHGTISPQWYAAAVAEIATRVPDARFFVFSDDIVWCRANLPVPPGSIFVEPGEGRHDAEHLILMSRCRHHIIANSSFSWWGAWLGSPDSVVIAPRRLLASDTDLAGLLPKRWVLM